MSESINEHSFLQDLNNRLSDDLIIQLDQLREADHMVCNLPKEPERRALQKAIGHKLVRLTYLLQVKSAKRQTIELLPHQVSLCADDTKIPIEIFAGGYGDLCTYSRKYSTEFLLAQVYRRDGSITTVGLWSLTSHCGCGKIEHFMSTPIEMKSSSDDVTYKIFSVTSGARQKRLEKRFNSGGGMRV